MTLIATGTVSIDTVSTPRGHRERVLGGSCAYFASAASFFGPVRIVAAAGDDLPDGFLKALEHFRGIDTRGLVIRKGARTFAWGARYSDDMNSRETLFTELGVLADGLPHVPPPFRDSTHVFLANSHPATQHELLEEIPGRRLVVADTMDHWIRTARAELDRLLPLVDGLVLNYDEAELLTGRRNTVAAARHILRLGPRFVVVKKGEHGCILAHRDGLAALPAYPTEDVVDPTGAGDAFAGGMMGHLAQLKGDPGSLDAVRGALAHGTITASFTIESFSLDRLAEITADDLSRRYHEFARMIRP